VAEENASNPLAAANNVDLRWQYTTSAVAGDTCDIYVDGAYMVTPKLKLKYELHYKLTDVTGSNESAFEKLGLKPICCPFETKLSEQSGLRGAFGFDWIVEFGNEDKGIGTDADQIAPPAGLAFMRSSTGSVLIPLVQHFFSYSGTSNVNQTSLRLIALQPFGKGYWAKLDAKVPFDWENDLVPATAEIQVGYNLSADWGGLRGWSHRYRGRSPVRFWFWPRLEIQVLRMAKRELARFVTLDIGLGFGDTLIAAEMRRSCVRLPAGLRPLHVGKIHRQSLRA
jgi:hypothetical protein